MNTFDFTLPILSIRQPWAWLIANAGKDIENRNWPTKYRGAFYVHASLGCTQQEYRDAVEFATSVLNFSLNNLPHLKQLERGGIIGITELVNCVRQSTSPWFTGDFGFVLRNSKPLPFNPCKGKLGFFRLDPIAHQFNE